MEEKKEEEKKTFKIIELDTSQIIILYLYMQRKFSIIVLYITYFTETEIIG